METPLESNKFIGERKKAIDAGEDSFVVNGETFKVTGSPATMTGMPTIPVRPVGNVFSPQTQQVANQMYGEEIPGSYDRALPQGMYATAQEAITAKTNSRMAQALGGALSPFSKKGCKYKK